MQSHGLFAIAKLLVYVIFEVFVSVIRVMVTDTIGLVVAETQTHSSR